MNTQVINVLLLEDNSDDTILIRRLLSKSVHSSFHLTAVDTLSEGVKQATQEPVDVILLDLHLIDSQGIETLIRARKDIPNVPIVVLTGMNDETIGIEAVQLGAQDYLIKGEADSHMLVRAMRYAIERKQAEKELRNHYDQLEELVELRTAELRKINEQLECEILERQQAENAEREQRLLAEALRDTATALSSTRNLSEALDRILTIIERVVPHDAAEIMLLEEGSARVVRTRGYVEPSREQELLSLRWPVANIPNLRSMVETRQPMIIPDITLHPDQAKMRIGPGWRWRSYVGTPIHLNGEVIGFINLESTKSHFFEMRDADRLAAFAEQAAIAIQNARLHEQEQTLAALQERERLARDLHDAVSQTLFSANMIAEALIRQLSRHPEKVEQGLKELHGLTRGAMAEMRALLLELRPSSLLEVEITSLFQQLADATRSRRRITISVQIAKQVQLPSEVKLALYRITQEALNNIAKHARATRADITLKNEIGNIILEITDDGRGFDPGVVPPTSLGLNIMRERAKAIGADLSIETKRGQGTKVIVICPDTQAAVDTAATN
jgi:signal transduction histidine kinase/CheY-like chemotaxis protein